MSKKHFFKSNLQCIRIEYLSNMGYPWKMGAEDSMIEPASFSGIGQNTIKELPGTKGTYIRKQDWDLISGLH